jgi:hypothetical protein
LENPFPRLGADETGTRKLFNKFLPLEGMPGKLKPMSIGFAA